MGAMNPDNVSYIEEKSASATGEAAL